MKLNNKGWGLTEMIIICCGVLFCLLIIIYYVNVFRGSVADKSDDTTTAQKPEPETEPSSTKYEDYLVLLQEKAISYALTLDTLEEESTFYIRVEDLINNNYVPKLEDCDGHVNVNKIGDTYSSNAYMTCSNFNSGE